MKILQGVLATPSLAVALPGWLPSLGSTFSKAIPSCIVDTSKLKPPIPLVFVHRETHVSVSSKELVALQTGLLIF